MQKSEVELMWEKLNIKFGTNRDWRNLNPIEQQQIVQAINVILSTLHR